MEKESGVPENKLSPQALRIKELMDSEGMLPARFADFLQIGRAVISHLLSGRNKPSLEIIMRIIDKMPHVNSDWLMTGNGTMYRAQNYQTEENAENPQNNPISSSDMFSHNGVNVRAARSATEYRKEIVVNPTKISTQPAINEALIYNSKPEKKISKIIIYYTDNTFETFEH